MIACLFSSVAIGAELDEHLHFLKPLIGPTWEGGFVGENTSDLVLSLHFEPILEGKAVKYSKAAPAANFYGETHFYWSPNRSEVLFINLTSRGIVGEGVASYRNGEIVLLGELHWPDKSMKFKTVLRIESNGVLSDTYTRKEDGVWVPGHFQEFAAKN